MEKETLKGMPPVLVAHRGYSGRYPENTLLAYQAAYDEGARYMELDLQLTTDGIPVLHHDVSLKRMAGIDIDIRDTKKKHFKAMHASYAERFAKEFAENKFTTFRKLCKWLKAHSDVTMFVEIKQESIDRFGIPKFIDEVHKRILKSKVGSQCIIISFNPEVIEYTRKISSISTGWVLPHWNDETHKRLNVLKPEFVFCNKLLLPKKDSDIFQGPWQWAIYNLDDVPSAINLANRGIPYLETNQIGTLMNDSSLSGKT